MSAPPVTVAIGRLLAVSVGQVAPLFARPEEDPESATRTGVASAIRKHPVSTPDEPRPVAVGTLGVQGDEHADARVHGGPLKAVYCYPFEHYAFWQEQLLRNGVEHPLPLAWGSVGENFTVSGLLETQVRLGDHLHIGSLELVVTKARQPCFKFDAKMRLKGASKLMVQSGHTGFYCRVLKPGPVQADSPIELLRASAQALTVEQSHRLGQQAQRELF